MIRMGYMNDLVKDIVRLKIKKGWEA